MGLEPAVLAWQIGMIDRGDGEDQHTRSSLKQLREEKRRSLVRKSLNTNAASHPGVLCVNSDMSWGPHVPDGSRPPLLVWVCTRAQPATTGTNTDAVESLLVGPPEVQPREPCDPAVLLGPFPNRLGAETGEMTMHPCWERFSQVPVTDGR